MRRALTVGVLAAAAIVPLASPASAAAVAAPDIVYVYSSESGVGAGVNVGTGHIAGAAVYYSGAACVSIGMADRICTG